MAVEIDQALMGLGDFTADLKTYDPDLLAELSYYRHIEFYEGERLVDVVVLLRYLAGRTGLGGRHLEYWLGLEDNDTGPVIEDWEFVAGNNKLSNPGFEDLDLYWRGSGWRTSGGPSQSEWSLVDGDFPGTPPELLPRSGRFCLQVVNPPVDDDPLVSDETFSVEVGQQYHVGLWAKRPGSPTVGRLRLRAVFDGLFNTPDLLPDPTFATWANTSEFSGDASVSGGVLRLGPTTQKQAVANPSFETGDLSGWDAGGSAVAVFSDDTHSGVYSAGLAGGTDDNGFLDVHAIDVKPKERWHFTGFVHVGPNAFFTPPNDAGGTLVAIWDSDHPDLSKAMLWVSEAKSISDDQLRSNHYPLNQDIDIPDGVTHVELEINFFTTDDTGSTWYWDDVTFTRTQGNTCSYTAPPFTVIPKRSYQGRFLVASDAGVVNGSVKVTATYSATGRTDVIQALTSIEHTAGQTTILDYTVTAPSGYDTVTLDLVATDVQGGGFGITALPLRDDDTSTWVIETVTDAATAGVYVDWGQDVTTPAGAETLHLEVVAEQGSNAWVVDDFDLHRIAAPTWTSAQVVEQLLTHPQTGNPILTAGSINGPELIQYDWRARNILNRAALKHLSRDGLAEPTREWRTNPDGSLDWGTATELFVDSGIVFDQDSVFLIDDPAIDETAEDRVERVKIIGADRPAVGQLHRFITGEADNTSPAETDFLGHPILRSRLIEDSTVDHVDFANAKARYEADVENDPRQNIRLGLSDPRALGRFALGDWIHVYLRRAGLEDLTNPMELLGRTVFPKKVRVVSVVIKPGAGWRAVLRRNGLDDIDITDSLLWNDSTTVEIEVGDVLPEFAVDPQGGAAGNQFRRFRSSAPR